MKTLAIDFDGVIHKYSLGWQDGSIYDTPIEGSIENIKRLMQKYYIVVFTARDIKQVRDWLRNYFDEVVASNDISWWTVSNALLVTNRKPGAVAYIDDRAFKFTDWESVIKEFG